MGIIFDYISFHCHSVLRKLCATGGLDARAQQPEGRPPVAGAAGGNGRVEGHLYTLYTAWQLEGFLLPLVLRDSRTSLGSLGQ